MPHATISKRTSKPQTMNCLDSSFLVDFLDGDADNHNQAVAWMEANQEAELAVPAICAFEVVRGTGRAGDDRFEQAVGFLRTLSVLELSLSMALAAGDLDSRLHASGTPLSARDTLVAAPALKHGGTLVTRDRDFEAIDDLNVVFYDE